MFIGSVFRRTSGMFASVAAGDDTSQEFSLYFFSEASRTRQNISGKFELVKKKNGKIHLGAFASVAGAGAVSATDGGGATDRRLVRCNAAPRSKLFQSTSALVAGHTTDNVCRPFLPFCFSVHFCAFVE